LLEQDFISVCLPHLSPNQWHQSTTRLLLISV